MQRGDQNTGERGKQHKRHNTRFEERDIAGRTRDRNRETLGKAAIAFADEMHLIRLSWIVVGFNFILPPFRRSDKAVTVCLDANAPDFESFAGHVLKEDALSFIERQLYRER
jgi:hypothetical protein